MISCLRYFSSGVRACNSFRLDPKYTLKCGLEIHTQLNTRFKLFSLSDTSFDAAPNSNVSFFDCGLPGTQPKLNPEAVLLALKAAVALGAQVQRYSSFDRKHYFYPDQPAGYQITQYFNPIARGGQLELTRELDAIPDEHKVIHIQQIQLEQDTGKIHLDKIHDVAKIDYNRSNMPLIELVTLPDFQSIEHVCAFVKKYQSLMKHIGVCTGDMETGAMRVDVNISINGHARVELKNLRSYSDIRAAIKLEYLRQVDCVERGSPIIQETRGYDGTKTVSLRSKDDTVDYRFFPDSELPPIRLSPQISAEIQQILPVFPEKLLETLMGAPYGLDLKLATFLVENPSSLKYFQDFWLELDSNRSHVKVINGFFFNTYLGSFTKLDIAIDLLILNAFQLAKLVVEIISGSLTNNLAKSIVMDIHRHGSVSNEALNKLIKDVEKDQNSVPALKSICLLTISENADVVGKIVNGNKKSIMFLVGLAMRKSNGKIDAKVLKRELEALIYESN